MGFLSNLFKGKQASPELAKWIEEANEMDNKPSTFGELVSEVTDGANLVNGKQTWELLDEFKNDVEVMKQCCDAELKTMGKANLVPAPYYFHRVAILSRKNKDYQQEIHYCELYINKVELFYSENKQKDLADVREGPTFKAICDRLPKAKSLYVK